MKKLITCQAEFHALNKPEGDIIKNVLIMGMKAAIYSSDVLKAAVRILPEKLIVFMDHLPEPFKTDYAANKNRSRESALGHLENIRWVENEGIRGDMLLNGTDKCKIVFHDALHNLPGGISTVLVPEEDAAGNVLAINEILSADYVNSPYCQTTLANSKTNSINEVKPMTETEIIQALTLEKIQTMRPDIIRAVIVNQQTTAEAVREKAELDALRQYKTETELNLQKQVKINEFGKFLKTQNADESDFYANGEPTAIFMTFANADKINWPMYVKPYVKTGDAPKPPLMGIPSAVDHRAAAANYEPAKPCSREEALAMVGFS